MIRLTVMALCGMLAGPISLFAADPPNRNQRQPPIRASWEWTIEERLQERFDAARIRERELVYQTDHLGNPSADDVDARYAQDGAVLAYRIDGARNPELFLPHELFDTLVTGFVPDPDLRKRQRGFYRRAILDLGFDDEAFWPEFELVAHRYVSLKYSGKPATTQTSAMEVCRARFEALQAARNLFGTERFDRFLYAVVAPSNWKAVTTNVPDPSRELREAARGCP